MRCLRDAFDDFLLFSPSDREGGNGNVSGIGGVGGGGEEFVPKLDEALESEGGLPLPVADDDSVDD